MELGLTFFFPYTYYKDKASASLLAPQPVVCCLVTDVSLASECWTFLHNVQFGFIVV